MVRAWQLVDEEVVFDVFELDSWAALSAWSEAGDDPDDVEGLVEDLREQGGCPADDVFGLELEGVAGPVPLLEEPAEDELAVGVWSRDDVGGVGRSPADAVLLDVGRLDDNNLASGWVDLGVFDAVEGEGAETGAVEDGVCAREVSLANVRELSSHKGDAKTCEVDLEVREEEGAVEIPSGEGDTELGARRQL
ncbi:hypothetical protein PMKS-001600 [Pichia membranifaciens]|uniref:Uncharacterized protein n=1 Tax=Pichia membranifaciens TaxID=4926 RepID=A0A1Q2YF75_9ASCO|nr:hypothetical protein PMKS-001600 [Pichia membranifaciens]